MFFVPLSSLKLLFDNNKKKHAITRIRWGTDEWGKNWCLIVIKFKMLVRSVRYSFYSFSLIKFPFVISIAAVYFYGILFFDTIFVHRFFFRSSFGTFLWSSPAFQFASRIHLTFGLALNVIRFCQKWCEIRKRTAI